MTAPGGRRYSAGTVFLNVVASYKGLQRAIGREAERDAERVGADAGKKFSESFGREAGRADGDIGKGMERQGAQAGTKTAGAFVRTFRATLKGALRDLPDIELDANLDDKNLKRQVADLREQISDLTEVEIGVDLTDAEALRELARIKALLEEVTRRKDIDIRTNFDVAAVLAQINAAEAQIRASWDRMSESMEKKGNETGGGYGRRLRASLTAALAELPDININADSSDVDREIFQIRRDMEQLRDVRIGVDVDAGVADEQLHSLERRLTILAARRTEIDVHTNALRAAAELRAVKAEQDKLRGSTADSGNAFRAFNGILLAAVTIGPALIPIIATLGAGLAALALSAIPLLAGGGVLALGLSGISDAVTQLGNVEKNAAKDALIAEKSITSAANGIRDAETALSRARVSAAETAEDSKQRVSDAVAAEAQAEKDAADSITQARESAAQAVQDAADRVIAAQRAVEDSQRSLTDAVQGEKDAQEALIDARKRAADQLEDLAFRVREGALAERQAEIDLFNATVSNNNAQVDGAATNLDKEQADIALQQAKLNLEEIRAANERLAEEKAQADKTGVAGTDTVITAQEQLIQAQQQTADAQRAVQDATEAASRALHDQVQIAADGQQAIADAIESGQQAVATATRGVDDALQQQARSARDSSQAVSDAQLRLADAQFAYQEALTQAEEIGSASARNLEVAYARLGPAGRAFAEYIYGLKPFFTELRISAQEAILPGLQAGIETFLAGNGGRLEGIITALGTTMGEGFKAAGEALNGPEWTKFFDAIKTDGPEFLRDFGAIIGNIATGIADLFSNNTQDLLTFSDGLVGASENFRDWARGSDNNGLQDFIAYVREVGPKVLEFFAALFRISQAVVVALAPYAEVILVGLTGIADFIAGIDPDVLGAILFAVLGLVGAFQVMVGLISIVGAALTLFSVVTMTAFGPVILVVGAVLLLAAAFVILWQNSETFRDVVSGAWGAIQDAVRPVIDWFQREVLPVLLMIFSDIEDGLIYLYENVWLVLWPVISDVVEIAFGLIAFAWTHVLEPVFSAIIEIIGFLWEFVAKPLFELIGAAFALMATVIAGAWEVVLKPLLDAFGALVGWLWEHVIDPIFGFIGDKWSDMTTGLRAVYDEYIQPLFDEFTGVLNDIRDHFDDIVTQIGDIWGGLVQLLKEPVALFMDLVVNEGIVDGINYLAGLINLDPPLEHVAAPGGGTWAAWADAGEHAEGGRVPGWSPTPTADNIPAWLTAGEYIQPVSTVAYYGEDIMDLIRKRRIPREQLATYAYGGLVEGRIPFAGGGPTWETMWDVLLKQFGSTGIRLTSAYRPGDSGYHGAGQAVDVGGAVPYPGGNSIDQMRTYKAWIAANYPQAVELIHSGGPGPDLKYGQPYNYGPEIFQQHLNHVHWAMTSIAAILNPTGAGPMTGTAESEGGGFLDILTNPLGYLTNLIASAFGEVGDFMDGPIGQVLAALPGVFLDAAGSWIAELFGLGGGIDYYSDETIDANLHEAVMQSAGTYGWGSGPEFEALSWIIDHESGWNPAAQNPTSSAYGLFQMVDSTWNAYSGGAPRDDVAAQIRAGLSYIQDRYGDPIAAKAFWEANGWYNQGGPVQIDQTPTIYDQGGQLPPGLTLALNATRHPEPILTHEQWSHVREFASNHREKTGALVDKIEFALHGGNVSAGDIADEIFHELRKVRAGSAHSRGRW